MNPGAATTTAGAPMTTAQATYALALWCLQAKNSGDGYGFPFDRPLLALAERVLILLDCLPRLLQTLAGDNPSGNRLFLHLARKVLQVAADPVLEKSVDELRRRCELFDQLRAAMRIADAGGHGGLNDDGEQVEMDAIRDAVGRFRRRLDAETELAEDPLCNKLAEQIDKYDDKLFAEPIRVQTPSGPALVYPQRTNNILEQFFRSLRRDHRRRTGDNRMHRALQTMLADTPLVKNFSNPHYMQILLDGRPSLEALFADLSEPPQPTILSRAPRPMARITYLLNRFDQCATHAEAARRFYRQKWTNDCNEGLFWLAAANLRQGRVEEAERLAGELEALDPWFPRLDRLKEAIGKQKRPVQG